MGLAEGLAIGAAIGTLIGWFLKYRIDAQRNHREAELHALTVKNLELEIKQKEDNLKKTGAVIRKVAAQNPGAITDVVDELPGVSREEIKQILDALNLEEVATFTVEGKDSK